MFRVQLNYNPEPSCSHWWVCREQILHRRGFARRAGGLPGRPVAAGKGERRWLPPAQPCEWQPSTTAPELGIHRARSGRGMETCVPSLAKPSKALTASSTAYTGKAPRWLRRGPAYSPKPDDGLRLS